MKVERIADRLRDTFIASGETENADVLKQYAQWASTAARRGDYAGEAHQRIRVAILTAVSDAGDSVEEQVAAFAHAALLLNSLLEEFLVRRRTITDALQTERTLAKEPQTVSQYVARLQRIAQAEDEEQRYTPALSALDAALEVVNNIIYDFLGRRDTPDLDAGDVVVRIEHGRAVFMFRKSGQQVRLPKRTA